MPPPVQDALLQIFEQWDGKGMPYGTRGEAIPIISRIVLTMSFLEVYHRMAGRDVAERMAREKSRKAFDSLVVDTFLSLTDDENFWSGLEDECVSDIVLSMEPEESSYRYIRQELLQDVTLALGDYADMKSPYLAGHSRRMAELAKRVAWRLAFPEPEATDIYRAAFVHDIGIGAVPSFVLNKPQDPLTELEREQMRLHPYHSERILPRVPGLGPVVPVVSAHHERMDGRGYHRGLAGERIPRGARILAVAAQFDGSHTMPRTTRPSIQREP